MPGDRDRVRRLLDETAEALAETSQAFDEEFPGDTAPPEPENVYRVPVGGNVQAALNDARVTGGVLLLAVGEHLVNLKVTDDPTAKPVIITSDTTGLPPQGTRITRDHLEGLARLKSANNVDPTITYNKKATGVHLTCIGFLPLKYDRTVIAFGSDNMTTVDEQPHDIVFDRILMVGDPVRGQHRGIQAHVKGFTLTNSSILDFHEQGRDSQALAAWNGGQDIVIRNCHLEAGAENIMFGGGNAVTEEMAPQRILIEDCLFSKNPAWVSGMQYPPTIKCLFEIKHARQLTLRHNILEHCWPQAWSQGTGLSLKSNSSDLEPWTLTEDVLIENNIIRKVGMPISVMARSDGGPTVRLMKNLTIRNNLCHDIDVNEWQGQGSLAQLSNMPVNCVIDHNTVSGTTWGVMDFWFDANTTEKGTGLTVTNNALHHGEYGIKCKSGFDATAWAKDLGYAPTVTSNALHIAQGNNNYNWGPGNVRIQKADYDVSFGADHGVIPGSAVANVPTTDGTTMGCDVTKLPAG